MTSPRRLSLCARRVAVGLCIGALLTAPTVEAASASIGVAQNLNNIPGFVSSGKSYACKRTKSKVPLDSIVTKKGPKDVRKEIDRLWNEVACEWAEMKRRAFFYNKNLLNPSKDEPPLRKAHDLVIRHMEDLGILADKFPQAIKGEFLATVVKMGKRAQDCRQQNRVGLGNGWCWYLDNL